MSQLKYTQMSVVRTMAKPVYTTTSDEEYTMNAVSALPTSAQMMPEAMPPMSAARNSTLVLGTNVYMAVKTMVTITYGRTWRAALNAQASGANASTHNANGLFWALASSPSATASRMGPRIMTLKYSVKRRAKLRGCATRHTKLKLVSTF